MKGEDMADRMEFPNTMKEFIDSYSFKDREEIYTNGAELIQVFRVEQAIEHYEKEIRAKTIDELKKRFRADFEEMMANNMEDCVNWADWLDTIAEEMKGGAE